MTNSDFRADGRRMSLTDTRKLLNLLSGFRKLSKLRNDSFFSLIEPFAREQDTYEIATSSPSNATLEGRTVTLLIHYLYHEKEGSEEHRGKLLAFLSYYLPCVARQFYNDTESPNLEFREYEGEPDFAGCSSVAASQNTIWKEKSQFFDSVEWYKELYPTRNSQDDSGLKKAGWRWLLDKFVPTLHRFLTVNLGLFSTPPEQEVFVKVIEEQRDSWFEVLEKKTYIPPLSKEIQKKLHPYFDDTGRDFFSPIQMLVREIAGSSSGGDMANAEISNQQARKAKTVRSLVAKLKQSKEPLILLGESGSGKSISLIQSVIEISDYEIKRIFPRICIFVRLGGWKPLMNPNTDDVMLLVKKSCPDAIKPYFNDLIKTHRLIIIFDGIDEMSRQSYNLHTKALSNFARACPAKTLFSCRISDFATSFVHKRLVLLDFTERHIREYLRKHLHSQLLKINGEEIDIRQIVRRLRDPDSAINARNPFSLYLFCNYVRCNNIWPKNRVLLLKNFYENRILRAKDEGKIDAFVSKHGLTGEPVEITDRFTKNLAAIACAITDGDLGNEIELTHLERNNICSDLQISVEFGRIIGLIVPSSDGQSIRFEHQRAQEYFTALHLCEVETKFDWLSRIDMQWWQQTLINVVQLKPDAVPTKALTEAIDEILEKFNPEQPTANTQNSEFEKQSNSTTAQTEHHVSVSEQAVASARLELGAHVLAEMPDAQSSRRLSNALETAATILGEKGNPVSKVKVLRMSNITERLKLSDTLYSLTVPGQRS